mmetsp:Transcript_54037/g.105702  ORF Transcript_54037/g.105702 Transcript_54037/m.105702 type:complete len:254 (-) Transcript_54037:99-860(-)
MSQRDKSRTSRFGIFPDFITSANASMPSPICSRSSFRCLSSLRAIGLSRIPFMTASNPFFPNSLFDKSNFLSFGKFPFKKLSDNAIRSESVKYRFAKIRSDRMGRVTAPKAFHNPAFSGRSPSPKTKIIFRRQDRRPAFRALLRLSNLTLSAFSSDPNSVTSNVSKGGDALASTTALKKSPAIPPKNISFTCFRHFTFPLPKYGPMSVLITFTETDRVSTGGGSPSPLDPHTSKTDLTPFSSKEVFIRFSRPN